MKTSFDPKGDLIVVRTTLFGPSGDFEVDFALDTGATLDEKAAKFADKLRSLGVNPEEV